MWKSLETLNFSITHFSSNFIYLTYVFDKILYKKLNLHIKLNVIAFEYGFFRSHCNSWNRLNVQVLTVIFLLYFSVCRELCRWRIAFQDSVYRECEIKGYKINIWILRLTPIQTKIVSTVFINNNKYLLLQILWLITFLIQYLNIA